MTRKLNIVIKQKNEELHKAYKQYAWLAENIDDVVWVMGIDGHFIYVSPSVEKLRGFTVEEVKRQPFEEVISEGSRERVMQSMGSGIEAVTKGQKPPVVILRVEQPCKDGSSVWTEVHAHLVVDSQTDDMRFIGVTWDISKTIEYEKKLQKMAVIDQLTNLYNRHKMDEMLTFHKSLAERYESHFGVIMLDIDHFKRVNDTYVHQAGDVVLQTFASILTQNSRQSDIIGRGGGEEFLILAPYATQESLTLFAENLRAKIDGYHFKGVGHITTSLGASIYQKNNSYEKVVAKADEALYLSKQKGRNRVTFLDI